MQEGKPLNNVVNFPLKSKDNIHLDLTPEQQLKMRVIEVFFQKNFLEDRGTTVDEAFAFIANELYAGNRGK
ncbi:hypothetical protein D3C72_2527190 [compost metagenome]